MLDDVRALEDLICGADLIFLLTDTRESRWLPTLVAAANSKVARPAAPWSRVTSQRPDTPCGRQN